MPPEACECVSCLPEASSRVNSEGKPTGSESRFAVGLSVGRSGQRRGAGRARCVLILFWIRLQSKEPSFQASWKDDVPSSL